MHDSRLRSLYKSVSWRIFGSLSTMGIVFIITHQWRFSLYIGGLEFISKIGLFYFHERLWNMFSRVHWSFQRNKFQRHKRVLLKKLSHIS